MRWDAERAFRLGSFRTALPCGTRQKESCCGAAESRRKAGAKQNLETIKLDILAEEGSKPSVEFEALLLLIIKCKSIETRRINPRGTRT